MKQNWHRVFALAGVGLAMFVGTGLRPTQTYTPQPGETIMQLQIEARGNVYIKLHTAEAPRTTEHIARLVQSGFYDGQRFFRVIRSPRPFLVQIGDPASRDASKLDDPAMGSGGSGARIPYEPNRFTHEAGTVGLATLPKDRDSGDSQFYITLAPAKFLDGNYTIFGQVVSGMDVVRSIERGDKVVAARILR